MNQTRCRTLALPIYRLAANRLKSYRDKPSFGVLKEHKMQKPEIQSIDHIVMLATDLSATIKFYIEILGMDHSSFQPPTGGPVRQSLHFGLQKINLHDAASPFIPHAKNPVAGSVDLCFITT
jgi:hypothetical protein